MAAQAPVVNVVPADGANAPRHGAAHADLLLDPTFDLRDQALVLLGPQQIGVALQPTARLAALRHHTRLFLQLRAIQPRRLVPGAPAVVKESRLAHEQRRQPLQIGPCKILRVPVRVVVTQPQRKEINLFLGELRAQQLVERCQLPGVAVLLRLCLGLLVYCLHLHPPSSVRSHPRLPAAPAAPPAAGKARPWPSPPGPAG